MKRALTGSVFFLTTLGSLSACDDIDVGRPDDPEGPPKILQILVQDETRRPFRGNVTDILLAGTPLIVCSQTNPCPAELGAADPSATDFCDYPESEMSKPAGDRVGTCPDPLHPDTHPPFVGEPAALPAAYDGPNTGNQIRIVFNKLLQPAIDALLRAEGQTIVRLSSAAGDIPVLAYYDSTGVTIRTAFPFAEPAGPAIVLKPREQLNASTTYTITVDGTQVKSKDGNALGAAGPFTFTTEAAFPLHGTSPANEETGALDVINTTDALSFFFNAAIGTSTTVVRTSSAVQMGGMGVLVSVFTDGTCDDANVAQLNVVRTSSSGEFVPWEPGEYTYDLSSVGFSAGPDRAALAGDEFGSPLTGTFTVTATDAEGQNPFAALTPDDQCE